MAYQPSCLVPGLYIGAAPPIDDPLTGFSTLVLCAAEHQPAVLAFRGSVWRLRLFDNEVPLMPVQINGLTRAATVAARRVSAGEWVLITCYAGLNRSGLVAARTLLELDPRLSPDQAIAWVRSRHDERAINNPEFVRVLRAVARHPAVSDGAGPG